MNNRPSSIAETLQRHMKPDDLAELITILTS